MAGFFDKLPWVNKAVQFPQRFYMNSDGGNDKNLLPPFTDWTKHANAVINSDYSLTLTATGSAQRTIVTIPTVVGQVYALTMTLVGDANIRMKAWDGIGATGTQIFSNSTGSTTFTALSVNTTIGVEGQAAGTFTFTNPQLELGSSATSFTPKKMYTIVQSGGVVTAAGTAVNATQLNRIEQGIQDNYILSIMGAL